MSQSLPTTCGNCHRFRRQNSMHSICGQAQREGWMLSVGPRQLPPEQCPRRRDDEATPHQPIDVVELGEDLADIQRMRQCARLMEQVFRQTGCRPLAGLHIKASPMLPRERVVVGFEGSDRVFPVEIVES